MSFVYLLQQYIYSSHLYSVFVMVVFRIHYQIDHNPYYFKQLLYYLSFVLDIIILCNVLLCFNTQSNHSVFNWENTRQNIAKSC